MTEAEKLIAQWLDGYFEYDANWSVFDVPGAREWFDQIGYTPSTGAIEVEERP